MHKMSNQWNFQSRKFSISLVWSYDLIRGEKCPPLMIVHEKKVFMSLSCKGTKLKTFTAEPVIARVEYGKLKNNYFLYQKL